jgi:Methyltransferase FkbM domain
MGAIKQRIKDSLLKVIPNFIAHEIINNYQNRLNQSPNIYYSQEGEDILLQRFLDFKTSGFYIDIGAHHPMRFSNTYLFYSLGWTGVNIDAMPGSMDLFNELRPRDINLEIPVSEKRQIMTYYVFNEPALNTFSKVEAQKKDGLREYKIVKTIQLETLPLSEILDKHLPNFTGIDFLTIDVEGIDLQVLKSNNWDKYQPSFILIESLDNIMENISKSEIYLYLKGLNYEFVAKTLNTMFFKKN